VNGYKDASYWLRQWELYPELAPPSATMDEFQLEFERMVVLDYIIRNTDRGNDNWLILYEPADVTEDTQSTGFLIIKNLFYFSRRNCRKVKRRHSPLPEYGSIEATQRGVGRPAVEVCR